MVKKHHGSKPGDWLYVGQQGVGHSTLNCRVGTVALHGKMIEVDEEG